MSGLYLPGLADMFAAPPTELKWATPGDLAQSLDHRNVQTPALDLIDQALVEAYNTPDSRLIISMPPQEGKALALDTPIATPTGWTSMGQLVPGDEVFGSDGRPCKVTWVSPIWTGRPCYTVRTGDGEAITADAAHEWVARLDRRSAARVVDSTLLAKTRSKNAQIAAAAPLDLPDVALPLHPYLLGVWLGDGHTIGARLTSADSDVTDRIRALGYPCRKESSIYGWSLAPAGGSSKCSPVRAALAELDVLGNKHVPDTYMRASAAQRLDLLQGLIDTDGYVSPRGQVEFTACNERLAQSVYELVYSLGAKATIHEGQATLNGKDCGPKWRVKFYMAGAAHMGRKAERCKDSRDAHVRYTYAEPAESVPTVCIEVDSPDHTFLAGRSLLPTHNSTRVGVMFPLWVLAQDKSKAVVLTSYSDRLVRKNSKNVRNFIITDGDKMGLSLARDSRSATQWKLNKERGGMYAVSIGGSLTGEPADLIIIDDPHKGAKEAESENQREDVWEWWLSTASARLGPGASVVMILTRWHEDDLAGRFMSAEDGHVWKYINIPAQADHNPDTGGTDILGRRPGEFMASARKRSREQWQATKTRQTARNWNALYQGRPSSAAGTVFKRDQWRYYDAPLWTTDDTGACVCTGEGDTLIQSWDMTFKSSQSSDYVVGQVWLKRGPNAYLLDQVRRRMDFTESVKAVEAMTAKWPQTNTKLIEDKANGPAILNVLRARMPGLIAVDPKGSKEARAAAVTWAIEAGNVHLPNQVLLPWSEALVEECAGFPTAAHDDQVDALTQALDRLMVNAGQGNAWLEYGRTKTETTNDIEGGGPVNGITSRIGTNNRPVRSERPVPTARLWGQ